MTANNWQKRTGQNFPFGNIEPTQYDGVRKKIDARHRRELLVAKPAQFLLADWDGDLATRRFNVTHGSLTFECYGTPSRKKRLFVFLSAGGRKHSDTVFHRARWHPWLDGVCLNVEDPTYKTYPGKLTAGWYLGTREQYALPLLTDLVKKVQDRYGIDDQQIHVIGSSAGGTAALKFASIMPGITVIAENPIFSPHTRPSAKKLKAVGIDLASPELRKRNSLHHLTSDRTSRFFIVLNAKSEIDFVDQLPDFLCEASLPPVRLGLNTYGNLHLYCPSVPVRSTSPHNTLMTMHEFRHFLRATRPSLPNASRAAMLDDLYESLRTRFHMQDQVFHLRHWAEFFRKIDIPSLSIPLPSETHIVRLPLVANKKVFYQVELGKLGHKATISLKAPKDIVDAIGTFKSMVATSSATLTEKNGMCTLTLGSVPFGLAPRKLRAFVKTTAPLVGQGKPPLASLARWLGHLAKTMWRT